AAFERKVNKTLTYAHLFNTPEKYRGQVVQAEGRLRRINRFDPPPEAARAGVNDRYEAWIINDAVGPNPYCVVFTEWPAGLPRDLLGKERIDQHIVVRFAGYFYKRYRYTAADSKAGATREALLLIGHSLRVLTMDQPGDAAGAGWAYSLIWVILGLFGG